MLAKVRVIDNRSLTPTTRSVRFTKPPGFQFRPVQFCGLELETEEGGIEYSMSLACSPTKDYLEFGARVASGTPWKRAFTALAPGDEAEIDGAYGHFLLDETQDAVLVAGGIGITPLKGMMEYATDLRLPIDVRLLYTNRTPQEIAYREELDDLARTNRRIQILHTITRPAAGDGWTGRTGRLDATALQAASHGLSDPRFYLCGLPSMIEDSVRVLLAAGVPRDRLIYEAFWGYE